MRSDGLYGLVFVLEAERQSAVVREEATDFAMRKNADDEQYIWMSSSLKSSGDAPSNYLLISVRDYGGIERASSGLEWRVCGTLGRLPHLMERSAQESRWQDAAILPWTQKIYWTRALLSMVN